MNSADRRRWLEPSAALPVDDGAPPDPDPKDSASDPDSALTNVLRAMRDAVEQYRDPSPSREPVSHVEPQSAAEHCEPST
jgi:hypothetical protein